MIKQPAMSPQKVAVAKLSPLNGSQMPHWKRFRARLPIVVTPARIVVAVLLLSRAHSALVLGHDALSLFLALNAAQ